MSVSPFSYDGAMKELQRIVQELQSDAIGIDQLSEKIKRASELIRLCKERLRSTEEEVKSAFDGSTV